MHADGTISIPKEVILSALNYSFTPSERQVLLS